MGVLAKHLNEVFSKLKASNRLLPPIDSSNGGRFVNVLFHKITIPFLLEEVGKAPSNLKH